MIYDIDVPGADPAAPRALAAALEAALIAHGGLHRPVVFACIGTDRSTGDALGPLVGDWLVRAGYDAGQVLGTLEHPLHALNLRTRLAPVVDPAERALVVAVDAALGPQENVGQISLRSGGLRPGHGVGKALPAIGDLAITATVNTGSGAFDAHVLQSTRLFVVHNLARTIGQACCTALRMTEHLSAAAQAAPTRAA